MGRVSSVPSTGKFSFLRYFAVWSKKKKKKNKKIRDKYAIIVRRLLYRELMGG